MRTLTTCPHCRAIVDDTPFCTICGKSPREEVEEVEAPAPPARDVDRRQLFRSATSVIGIIAVVALIWAWTHQPAPVYVAPPLPAPTPTEPVIRTQTISPTVEAPTGDQVLAPLAPVDPGPRVLSGRAPWEDAAPVNHFTGEPLSAADYTAGRERVAALLDAVPPPWSLGTLDGSNDIDLAGVEATQPFAARSFAHDQSGPVGEVWIAAAPEDDAAGAAYVATAREILRQGEVIETLSPRPGIRLVHLLVDGEPIWLTELASPSVVMLFVAGDTDAAILASFVEDWLFAALDPVA